MVVFAGTNGATENNELWTLDLGGTPNWTFWPIGDPVTPAARGTHGAIYDPVRDRMIISGGTDFTNLFQDTWALPLAGAFHWQPLAPNGPTPSPRFLSAWAYDPGRDRLIEYGGTNFAGIRSDDAWALQFGTPDQWLLLEPAGLTPPGRSDHCAAFDPVHDRLLFAGGRTAAGAGLANDLVSLDWAAQLTSVDPPTTLLETALSPPFPNPTHDAVTIRFVARDRGPVRLAIHDVSGRRVRTLEDAAREPGAGVLRWDGRDERGARVAPGVYLVQMRSQGRVLSRRIVLME
jgi:hypothetical protein